MDIEEYGTGHPFLLLHGGAGPFSVSGFAQLLATERHARVLVPTHPGFNGSEPLADLAAVAAAYVQELELRDLVDVTVVGNSIGGWIAAEIAVLASPRVSSVIIVDGVGIEVDGHPVADFFSLSFDDLARLSFYNPEGFRIDPAAMSEAQRAVMTGNRATIAHYTRRSDMAGPTLLGRLASVDRPALVVWGDSDGIADPVYGKAFADAIPGAEWVLMEHTGHLPQLESPAVLLPLVWDFADRHATNRPA